MARGKIHTINLAVYPQVLTVAPGDTVRVVSEFDYVGPAISCRMISAIWHPTLFDPHNEIVRGNRSFSIPSSPLPGHHITVTIDLLVPSGEVGTDYGLYSSIRDVPGPDIYATPKWLENIITIEEVPAEYTLEVSIEPPGAGHVLISSKGPYSAGEVVTLVATPYSGYEFDYWGGWPPYPGRGSTSATLKLTMDADWWVVAVFREVAPPPPPPECTSGDERCVGDNLYQCINGQWVLVEYNSPQCMAPPPEPPPPPPPECTSGDERCVGGNLYQCINGNWRLVEYNSPQCM